jgi:FecR protein
MGGRRQPRVAARVVYLSVLAAAVLFIFGYAGLAVTRHQAGPARGPARVVPTLSAVVGTVEVRREGAQAWEPAGPGASLHPGNTIRTGPRSKAEVTHVLGIIRLYEHTSLHLAMESDDQGSWIRQPLLLTGQALFEVVPARLGDLLARVSTDSRVLFEVHTPHVIAGVKGTRFAVLEAGRHSAVVVYGGVVETSAIVPSGAKPAVLMASQLATYEAGRLRSRGSFRDRDDWGGWTRPEVHAVQALAAKRGDAHSKGWEIPRPTIPLGP